MDNESIRILIINSHSNNRGDEAAQHAMISSIKAMLPQAEFDVVTASKRGLDIQDYVKKHEDYLAAKRTTAYLYLLKMLLCLILAKINLKMSQSLFKGANNNLMTAFVQSDFIISAPGGPYIGDLYSGHEIRDHLFYLWLAKFLKKPVMIYAPSAGPFGIKWRNFIRKKILNRVDVITLRDLVSLNYLKELGISKPVIKLAADSAFQSDIKKELLADDSFKKKISDNRKFKIGVTPVGVRWNFKNAHNPLQKHSEYVKDFAKIIDRIIEQLDAEIYFFPQLYNTASDIRLINKIKEKVHAKENLNTVSPGFNCEIQQALMTELDLMIGNRYHSVIFALKAKSPTICICYEHKSKALMKTLDLENCLIEVEDFNYESFMSKFNFVWSNKEELFKDIDSKIKNMKQKSQISTEAFIELYKRNNPA